MHLDHKIPWNTVASYFAYIEENPARTPRKTDLFARDLPRQGSDLNHFSRILQATISEFSNTERAKYPAIIDIPSSEPLFDDSLLSPADSHPFDTLIYGRHRLNQNHQRIDYWIERALKSHEPNLEPYYGPGDEDLAFAVQALMTANSMNSLLRLAQHPQIPLARLHNSNYGGIEDIAIAALQDHLLFNVAASVRFGAKPGSKNSKVQVFQMSSYHKFLEASDVHLETKWPHQKFWLQRATNGLSNSRDDFPEGFEPLESDVAGVKEYVRMCFELLYRYDMLIMEYEEHPRWEQLIAWDFEGWEVKRRERLSLTQILSPSWLNTHLPLVIPLFEASSMPCLVECDGTLKDSTCM